MAISPDGKYAVVAVRMGDDLNNAFPGLLRVYDISNPAAVTAVKDITVGIGPDSIALAGGDKTLRAVVAIEDEETDTEGDASIPGVRPGRIDVVGLQDLYGGTRTDVQSLEVTGALADIDAPYAADPQPEFVSINKNTQKAVVSLQENNAFAIVDLSDANTPRLEGVYSTGTVTRTGNADILSDKEISLVNSFTGRREADAVAWVNHEVFATANEGDTSVGDDGVFPGARGFTLMDVKGAVIYETGEKTEKNAVRYGHYPDNRSRSKGVEIEGVTSASFDGTPFLFVGSERGSFAEVYRLDDVNTPQFVQLLPTGLSPEGVITVTGRDDDRQLFITANEVEGSLTLYQYYANGPTPNPADPQIVAQDANLPWGALSGLTTDGVDLYAVPDNAFSQSRIYRINPVDANQGKMTLESATLLTLADGSPLKVDPEGIARVSDGFWIAAEGSTVATNELIKVNEAGVVQHRVTLSPEIQARFAKASTSTGFEGVAASADGATLFVALQRGFDTAQPYAAILKYDTATGIWSSAQYPLDQHSKDPATYWMGLSEIQLIEEGRLLILERDKGGGEGGAINAEYKRIYSVQAADVVDGATLTKTLIRDLRKDYNYLHEKAEGMVVYQGDIWVVNDNDGGGWTRMLNAGTL